MEHEVFISYSHKDMQITNALVNKLEENGTGCWIAPRNISPGKNWANAIAEAIPKSKVFLLVFSAHSNASEQVLREVEIAVHNKLIVIPVRIEDIMPSGGMQYYLATTQWIDVKGTKIDSKLSAIYKTVKNIIDELDKGENPENIKSPARIMQSAEKGSDEIKPGKNKINLIIGIAFAVLVGVTIFLYRDTLFNGQNQNEQNLNIDQTKNFNPNMVVNIENEALKEAIITTLENMGEIINGDLKVSDMQKLETLRIASREHAQWYKENLPIEIVNDMMTSMVVVDGEIKSLNGLQYATNLKHLTIAGREISDLSPIKNLTNLVNLDLPSNRISDISPVSSLRKLKTLDISHNHIVDINPLKSIIGLESLRLNNNKITDISAFSELQSLTIITLESNDISDISRLRDFQSIESLSIYANPIMTLEPIKDVSIQYLFVDRDIYVTNAAVINELEQNGTELIIEEAEETSLYTPEDFDLDYDMKVYLTNPVLEEAVIKTLESMGHPNETELTIEKIFKMETLIISSVEYSDYAKSLAGTVVEDDCYVYITDQEIEDFSKLQYAKNLKVLIIAGMDINGATSFAGVESIESLFLIGDSQKLNIHHLGIIEIDLTNIRHLHVENSKIVFLGTGLNFNNLEEMSIINSELNNLDGLQKADNLTSLNLSGNTVNDIDMTAIMDTTSLKTLQIEGFLLEDPEGILHIESLEQLTVSSEFYSKYIELMNDLKENGCEIEIVD